MFAQACLLSRSVGETDYENVLRSESTCSICQQNSKAAIENSWVYLLPGSGQSAKDRVSSWRLGRCRSKNPAMVVGGFERAVVAGRSPLPLCVRCLSLVEEIDALECRLEERCDVLSSLLDRGGPGSPGGTRLASGDGMNLNLDLGFLFKREPTDWLEDASPSPSRGLYDQPVGISHLAQVEMKEEGDPLHVNEKTGQSKERSENPFDEADFEMGENDDAESAGDSEGEDPCYVPRVGRRSAKKTEVHKPASDESDVLNRVPRRRGRPKGSKNNPSRKVKSESLPVSLGSEPPPNPRCRDCGLVFPSSKDLGAHRRSAHRIACPVSGCGYLGAWSEKGILRHVNEVHKRAREFKCDLCEEAFALEHQLEGHRNKVHLKIKPYACSECDRKLETQNMLDVHMLRHKHQKLCPICGIVVNGVGQVRLRVHIAVAHTREKLYQCQFCDEAFILDQQKHKHEAVVHGYKKARFEHFCSVCGKLFRGKAVLAMHQYRKHNLDPGDLKMFPCPICDRKFFDRTKLRDHMKIHDGSKPHKCPDCEYTTTTFGNLKIHLKWRHKRTVKRVFPHGKKDDSTGYVVVDECVEEEAALRYAAKCLAERSE